MGAFRKNSRRHILIGRMALLTTCLYIIKIAHPYILPSTQAITASGATRTLVGNVNPNNRLPRTSASQLNNGNSPITNFKIAAKSLNTTRNGSLRIREQQLINIFEIIITTLEGKLSRIDHLDKTVDLIKQNMEALQNRVVNNIEKTDEIISQLDNIKKSISNGVPDIPAQYLDVLNKSTKLGQNSSNLLNERILKMDRKVTDIDNKLEVLKEQLDTNFLQVEDFTGEASEKKPVTINVSDITKVLSSEAMTQVSSELSDLRYSADNIDKKLQFHINVVSDNIGRMMNMMHEIHFAVVDSNKQFKPLNLTTEKQLIKSSKLNVLVKQIQPMNAVSEKIDEVWDVVVDTKSTVDNLLPKSAALLTQTQRQERAIDEIHQDLKTKTNLIINNLDKVEKRLKKQENYVQILAKLPEPSELTPNQTNRSLLEYDSNNNPGINETTNEANLSSSISYVEPSIATTILPTLFTSSTGNLMLDQLHSTLMSTNVTYNTETSISGSKSTIRKERIIFPSIKKKPAIINSTTANDIIALKDIKPALVERSIVRRGTSCGFSCIDILNAGMKQSGVFYLQIRGTTYWFLKVYCDQETTDGGWTVIQRRADFGDSRENFNRDWADYKNGFGEPGKDFWLGNENIYMLTNNEEYSLRVELEDFEGNKRVAGGGNPVDGD
ncbi:uncharacterized protein LOC108149906 isoform X3 [Drosophila elegans]|uniref:uncharacterized protein LOC108149906 isoform X3 n=1 Tax=Drosophila elegans TaxID=30023 RepID=UPI001BC83274|nr:uncharacterized protein LOC108149906 isoform X3 [Drosophila elegans]